MADMVELANSNGDTVTDSAPSENKVNGELNGSCNNKDESPMDVDDDSSAPLTATTVNKKVVNNEIVNTTEDTPQEDIEEAEEATEEDEDESSQDMAEEEKEESEEVNGNVDKPEEEEEVGEDKLETNKDVEEEEEDEPEQMEVDEVNSIQEEDKEEEEGASDTEEGTAADPLAGGAEDVMSQESEEAQNTDDNVDDADEVELDKEEKSEESKEENEAEEDKKDDEEEDKDEGEKDVSDVTNGGGDSDVMEVDGGDKKLNGSSSNATSEDAASDAADASGDGDTSATAAAVSSEATPTKKSKKAAPVAPLNLTPRRSSRNLNKSKSYTEKDEKDIELIDDRPNRKKVYDDDIQEISAVDPLADTSSTSISMKQKVPRPIVISDTKRLVEISQQQQQAHVGQHHLPHHTKHNQVSITKAMPKKEPTLVIIDTNSILSGRGPVPIAHSTPTTSISLNRSPQLTMMPVNKSSTVLMNNKPSLLNMQQKASGVSPAAAGAGAAAQAPPILLPSLTDDMFVVEAPSFIVPYVYEKPPVKPLKEFVEDLDKTIKKEKEEKEKEKTKKKEEEKEAKKSEDDEKKSEKEKEEMTDKEKKTEDEEDKDEKGDDKARAEKDVKSESKDKQEDEENEESEMKKKDEKGDVMDVTKSSMDKDANKQAEDTKEDKKEDEGDEKSKKASGTTTSYFENPLGKFFMHIGINLVQEHVQSDLLKSQKRKREREGTKVSSDTLQAIDSLTKTLEFSKENNDPFRFDAKKCEYCNFKTESKLVMAHHLETPHMKNYIYRCNFCPLEVRSPHDIMFHMEAEHNVRGRLEKAPAFHQCPSCLFEDNQKGKLTRHLLSCAKKYRPERNQEPPLDWEPPAKIPRVSRNRPNSMSPGNAVYHAAISGLKQGVGGNQQSPQSVLPKMMHMAQNNAAAAAAMSQALMNRQRGRPLGANTTPGLLYRPQGPNAQNSLVLPPQYQIQAGQVFHQQNKGVGSMANSVQQQQQQQQQANKLLNQPSISITPLPRQQPAASNASPLPAHAKPGRPQQTGGGKNTFVICEICDGYIKDLEQLRNHMQWIHKVKIHPKMIYNRPPLNCQKCQFRFFTDQGLERHLLGSHGLVTSSMQEAANKGKDGGRCPVCGRVYQWKLLNHVARDHNMQLKPAHLSYKCTVCTATFGMYRQFENHVYSAHSSVPKRPADKKPQTSSSSSNDSMRPLKINDEITIIPQPPRAAASSVSSNKVKITPVPSKK